MLTKPVRRTEDYVESRNPLLKMNLDRRIKSNERRVNDDPSYMGPVRRLIIDRRVNIRDRRSSD